MGQFINVKGGKYKRKISGLNFLLSTTSRYMEYLSFLA